MTRTNLMWLLVFALWGQSLLGLLPSPAQAQGQRLAHLWHHAEALEHHHHHDQSLHLEPGEAPGSASSHWHAEPPTPQAAGVPSWGDTLAWLPSAGPPGFVSPHWPPHRPAELLRPPQHAD